MQRDDPNHDVPVIDDGQELHGGRWGLHFLHSFHRHCIGSDCSGASAEKKEKGIRLHGSHIDRRLVPDCIYNDPAIMEPQRGKISMLQHEDGDIHLTWRFTTES